MSESSPLETTIKIMPVLVACGTFIWGIWEWRDNANQVRESRRIEATRPFLELQLKLYTETALVTSRIARSCDETTITRFWELFYGELALVEDQQVATAMVEFSNALKPCDQSRLSSAALHLTQSMRDSLANSWDTDAWQMRPAARPPS